MSDEELAAIESLCEKTSPGPWECDYGGTVGHIKSLADGERHTPTVARYDIWFGHGFDEGAESLGHTREREQANGEFIALARSALPRLLAEAKRLQSERRLAVDVLREIMRLVDGRSLAAQEKIDALIEDLSR